MAVSMINFLFIVVELLWDPSCKMSSEFDQFQVQKGKQGTKGQKQIVKENESTLQFYRNMALFASAIYLIAAYFLYDLFSFKQVVSKHFRILMIDWESLITHEQMMSAFPR